MNDWNVVATTQEHQYGRARQLLGKFGQVGASHFFNVILMKVDDVDVFVAALADDIERHPEHGLVLGRVAPAQKTFDFGGADDFEDLAKRHVLDWLPRVAGRTFHVRVHRRGFKGELSTPREERFVDDSILEATRRAGRPAQMSFEDPDVILAIDTVDNRAGMALWERDDLRRLPFLKLD